MARDWTSYMLHKESSFLVVTSHTHVLWRHLLGDIFHAPSQVTWFGDLVLFWGRISHTPFVCGFISLTFICGDVILALFFSFFFFRGIPPVLWFAGILSWVLTTRVKWVVSVLSTTIWCHFSRARWSRSRVRDIRSHCKFSSEVYIGEGFLSTTNWCRFSRARWSWSRIRDSRSPCKFSPEIYLGERFLVLQRMFVPSLV